MKSSAVAPHPLAFIALLAGAVAIGFAPIFVRLADVSPAASAFWRVALATPLLWAWAMAADRSQPAPDAPETRRGPPGAALLAGVFFACDLAAWHVAIAWTSVANATLEANVAPVFVALGAWLLWQQRPRKLFMAALALTLCGALLLIGPNARMGDRAFTGDLLGLLTAVFYAGYMLSLKRAAMQMPTARVMMLSTTMSAAVLLPWALATSEQFLPAGMQGWAVLAGMALLAQVGGQSLIAFALAHLPAALSSTSLILQPVLSMLFAWVLLGESMAPLQMLGAAIVLLGIYLARRTA